MSEALAPSIETQSPPLKGQRRPHFDAPRIAVRICQIAAGSLAIWAVARALSLGYALERDLWLARISGWTAAGALLLSLAMTPLARLNGYFLTGYIPKSLWSSLRRSLGITAASAALVHSAWVAFTLLDRSWNPIISHAFYRAGLLTLCILVPLLLTSFPIITRKLGIRLWKPLHRLSYLAAVFLLQHLLLAPFASRRWVLAIFAASLGIALLRLLPRRSRRSG